MRGCNPADILGRKCDTSSLNETWWSGPPFLKRFNDDPEVKNICHRTTRHIKPHPIYSICKYFSNWKSLTSQTASISVSFPSSCTNLADCIHVTTENQSKDDGINPKIKHSVKSIQRINSDTNTQGTIIAAFDKCQRKLSLNKEADTERGNLKISRSNHMDVYGPIISSQS